MSAASVRRSTREARDQYVAWRRLVVQSAFVLAICLAFIPARTVAGQAPSAGAKTFFLVATPNMPDPLFQESVILMLPPTNPPLIAGLIVNKPTTTPVNKVFPHARTPKDEVAYFGGPVYPSDPSLILRTMGSPAGAPRLFDHIYVSTDPDSIAAILKNLAGAKNLRLVLGRAQWSLDQLHAEIMEGSWYVLPADPDMVFSTQPKHLWRELVERGQLQQADLTRSPTPPVLEFVSGRPSAGYFPAR